MEELKPCPSEHQIMCDFEAEKYEASYCFRKKCDACEGVDASGEPNGYGCQGLEDRIEIMYQSILKRRLKKIKACNTRTEGAR